MKALDAMSKVIVVHGVDDTTCPYPDAVELVENMQTAGLDVEPHFIEDDDLDGTVFTSSGHALGNRTEIVFRVAGQYLQPDSPDMLRREPPSDFERREDVRYGTSGGEFVISYEKGYPIGRFEPATAPPQYREHQDLTYYLDGDGKHQPIETAADWDVRRQHILAHLQRVMGHLPGATSQISLNVEVIEELHEKQLLWRKISFQSDPFDRVTAWLLLPSGANESGGEKGGPLPAVLCLHQTTQSGKDEPTGMAGSPNMHYAIELSRRGYITFSPDYPSPGGACLRLRRESRVRQWDDEGHLGQHPRGRSAHVDVGSRCRSDRRHRPFARRTQCDVHRCVRTAPCGSSFPVVASPVFLKDGCAKLDRAALHAAHRDAVRQRRR